MSEREARVRRTLCVVVWLVFFCSNPAFAAPLNLTLNQVTDISALNFGAIGGIAYDSGVLGRLWIADGSGVVPTSPGATNQVALIDPLTGTVTTSFDASAGNVLFGPDGVGLDPVSGDLFLFSAFTPPVERTAGVTMTNGTAVRTLTIDTSKKYVGAAFKPGGQLWVADRPNSMSEKDNLYQLDPTTGTAIGVVLIKGISFNPNLSGLAFDPFTGNPFAYDTDRQSLLEIDLTTGGVLSETFVGSFFTTSDVAGGIAFNDTGDRLYLGSGLPIGHPTGIVEELIVLNRFAGVGIPIPGAFWLISGALAGLAAYRRTP